jgi:ABC-type uncharacterized transport system permease subunit
MLQANNYLRDEDGDEAFEDYSIFMYRQNAPEFTDRVKELEKKLLYPVRMCWSEAMFRLTASMLFMRLTQVLFGFPSFRFHHSLPSDDMRAVKYPLIAQLLTLCSN